jgi:hypothetical protein
VAASPRVQYLLTQDLVGYEFRPFKLIGQAAEIKRRADVEERRELKRADYWYAVFEVENNLRIAAYERRKIGNRCIDLILNEKLIQDARSNAVAV